MRHHPIWIILALVAIAGCKQFGPHADFGEPMKLEEKATPVSVVMEDPKSFDGQYLRLEGEVTSVCASKGCWIRMAPAGSTDPLKNVFVKFTCPIEGRLIPMDAKGQQAIVEGTLEVGTISEDDARHYAEDAGQSPEEIAKIKGEQPQYRMKSPAARILGMEQPPAPPAPTSQPTTQPKS